MDWLNIMTIALTSATIIVGGLWTLHQSIKAEFKETRREGVERGEKLEGKFDGFAKEVRETYVPKILHMEVVKRLDSEIDNLKRFAACPMDNRGE